jgi:bacteriocin-like protein
MDANSRKKPIQLEINDLIAEAVVNAEARRNQAEELSDEELAAVNGGYTFGMKANFPITAGMNFNPPIAVGYITVKPVDEFASLLKSQENIA